MALCLKLEVVMRQIKGVTVSGLLIMACMLASPPLLADDQWDDDWVIVHEQDPWESWNRKVFGFNETMDRWVLKPVAKGYRTVTPMPVRRSVRNVLRNWGEGRNLANNLLQGKVTDAGVDVSRFLFNSTFGLLGVFDVATKMGLQGNNEDFGQTLGKWGVKSGPYVVLPLLGPSTLRDAPAMIPDTYTTVYPYISNHHVRYGVAGVQIVSIRESLLDTEKLMGGDKYSFIRNAYLQNREYRVNDGNVEDDF